MPARIPCLCPCWRSRPAPSYSLAVGGPCSFSRASDCLNLSDVADESLQDAVERHDSRDVRILLGTVRSAARHRAEEARNACIREMPHVARAVSALYLRRLAEDFRAAREEALHPRILLRSVQRRATGEEFELRIGDVPYLIEYLLLRRRGSVPDVQLHLRAVGNLVRGLSPAEHPHGACRLPSVLRRRLREQAADARVGPDGLVYRVVSHPRPRAVRRFPGEGEPEVEDALLFDHDAHVVPGIGGEHDFGPDALLHQILRAVLSADFLIGGEGQHDIAPLPSLREALEQHHHHRVLELHVIRAASEELAVPLDSGELLPLALDDINMAQEQDLRGLGLREAHQHPGLDLVLSRVTTPLVSSTTSLVTSSMVCLQRLPKHLQRLSPVGDGILLRGGHLRVGSLLAFRLEDGVKTERGRPARSDDGSGNLSGSDAHLAPDDKPDDGTRHRSPLRERGKYLPEALCAELADEVLHVRAGQALEGLAMQARVLDEEVDAGLLVRHVDLGAGNLLGLSLQLRNLKGKLLYHDGRENLPRLLELVRAAGDEREFHRPLLLSFHSRSFLLTGVFH